MFTKHKNTRILVRNAVPKPVKKKSQKNEAPDSSEDPDKPGTSGEVVACRVCLAVDGRLYAISGSGLEDELVALTGAALPTEENIPHHLCAFCFAKLSKCAAFRDSCQRSTALLQTLLKRGTLNMNAIKAYSCKTQQEIRNLTSKILYQFGTGPVLEISPLNETDICENAHEEVEYTEVEYLDDGDFMQIDDDDDNFESAIEHTEQETQQEHTRVPEVINEARRTINPNLKENKEPPENIQKKATRRNPSLKNNVALDNSGTRTKTRARKSRVVTDISDADMSSRTRSKTETYKRFAKEFNFEITLLSEEEQKQKIEEKKMRNLPCSCDLCGRVYARESTMVTHKNTYHDPSLPFECSVCLYRFRSVRDLRKHRREDRHRAVFTCNECGSVFRKRALAREHYFMHQGKTYTCPYCANSYGILASYYGHINTQHPDENEACDECGETFQAGQGLVVHKAMRHRADGKLNAGTKCKDCGVQFLNAEALQKHCELSSGRAHAALWPCAACGDSCGSEAALAAHAQDKHASDQHYCIVCDKTFANTASFKLHVDRKHKNRKHKIWRRCGKASDTNDVSSVCDICGKVFENKTAMRAHVNGHLGLNPFECRFCPKAFTSHNKLQVHMRVHTGERPYQCKQCPMAFTIQGNFTRHLRNVHMRMQSKCELCGKQMGAASVAAHVRAVHMKQPYVRKRSRAKKPPAPASDTET